MDTYENSSISALLKEIERSKANNEIPNETIFMRMLRELHVYQMENELQNRELLETKQALEQIRDRYEDVYDFSPMSYLTFDSHSVITELNLAAAAMLGKDRKSLLETSFIDFVSPHSRSNFLAYLRACIAGEEDDLAEFELELPGGKSIMVKTTKTALISPQGNPPVCRIAFTEVTDYRIAELKLRLASKVLEHTQEGIVLTDSLKRIIAVNPAFLKTTGYTSEEVIGFTPSILKSGLHDEKFYQDMHDSFVDHDGWKGEIWNKRKNGEIYPEWANIKVIRKINGEVDCYIGLFSDITNQEEMKQKLNELAYYDELTGLANRSLLYDRLQHALVQSRRGGFGMAVLFLDLDHFKEVNDNHGHEVGDLVIKEAADRLTYCLREGDTLSRLGGDEFVAILTNYTDTAVPAQIADRMVRALEKPFLFDNDELYVTTSVGISIFPDDGDEVTILLKNADKAMYCAKSLGRSNFQFFEATAK